MDVLITCKYEEDLIKNEGARVLTTLYINFSDAQGQITLVSVVVSGQNLNSSKLLCMSSLPARMRLIKSKMEELECSQDFSHYKSMRIFPDTQGQLTPQSLVRSGRILNSSEMLWMSSLPASMVLVVVSGVGGGIWRKFELIQAFMSSLPARMRMINSKMKELECSQDFFHYKSMGIFQDAQGQLSLQSLVRSG